MFWQITLTILFFGMAAFVIYLVYEQFSMKRTLVCHTAQLQQLETLTKALSLRNQKIGPANQNYIESFQDVAKSSASAHVPTVAPSTVSTLLFWVPVDLNKGETFTFQLVKWHSHTKKETELSAAITIKNAGIHDATNMLFGKTIELGDIISVIRVYDAGSSPKSPATLVAFALAPIAGDSE
jgi:hypothetical protein